MNATSTTLLLGHTTNGTPCTLPLTMANRHGLIAGATGTGKTMTLRHLAEQFSNAGTPVFLVDVKGDLSGFGLPGTLTEGLTQRLTLLNMAPESFPLQAYPSVLWDVNGQLGHPLRTTLCELGPLLLSRLLNLNETQTAVLTQVFEIADDQTLPLLDIDDLKATLNHVETNSKTLKTTYGSLPTQSLSAILRQVNTLATETHSFFGEPALQLEDLLTPSSSSNKGLIHILNGQNLMQQPTLYATTLLWLLAELYEQLPEVGDLPQPKLILFFDEAHLLFTNLPPILEEKITQIVRLIRSKGVGLYFVTQNPMDIPEAIRSQLSNRILHALRAFSPKETRAIKAMADSFPTNPTLGQVEDLLPNLAVGQALISCLAANGQPQPAQNVLIHPASSYCGAITPQQRHTIQTQAPHFHHYATPINRTSAYELLQQRLTQTKPAPPTPQQPAPTRKNTSKNTQDPFQQLLNSTVRAIGSELGRSLMRGLLGSTGNRRRP